MALAVRVVCLAFAWLLASGGVARAGEPSAEPEDTPNSPAASIWTYELWAGADGTQRYGSIWTGLTWAPFGSVRQDGWRLRSVAGAGRYGYDGWRVVNGLPQPSKFKGLTAFADALVGYHVTYGNLTLKPFAGIAMVEHWILPADPVSRISGRKIGAKLALESWLNIGSAAWLNVDASWSQVHTTTNLRARLGYRIWGDLSLGVEASSLSDVSQEMQRAGLFVRYAWERGEINFGGGIGGRSWTEGLQRQEPYLGVTVLGRF